jgi:hypothetical protein
MAMISGFGEDLRFAPSHASRIPGSYCGIAAVRCRLRIVKESGALFFPRPK